MIDFILGLIAGALLYRMIPKPKQDGGSLNDWIEREGRWK